jgi:hypothetical protein
MTVEPERPVETTECPLGIATLIGQLRECMLDVTGCAETLKATKGKGIGARKKALQEAEQRHTDALAKLGEGTDLQVAIVCMDILDDPASFVDGEGAAPLSNEDVYRVAIATIAELDKSNDAVPAVEYPHCACGAVLALDVEKTAGLCESCLERAKAGPETIPANGDVQAPVSETAAPQDVPLPFPPPPVEPFDFQAAAVEMFKHNRIVESMKRVYDEAAESAKDAKKQWEAAAVRLGLLISDYDRRARESDEANRRRAELQRCYQEQLEHAAAAATDEAPAVPQSSPEERVPDLAGAEPAREYSETIPGDAREAAPDAPTPLSDALPACPCGNALALDTEKARGTCDECHVKA